MENGNEIKISKRQLLRGWDFCSGTQGFIQYLARKMGIGTSFRTPVIVL
jgi:hypothetical protein